MTMRPAFRADPSSGATASGRLAVTVAAKDFKADGVVALTLVRPDGGRLPDWTPGAHIDLILPAGGARQYSLCGDRWSPDEYRIAVLREADSRGGSAYVHDQLRIGDQLGLGGPRNNFHVVPSRRYRFIAGGIGITPILPMIDHAERLGAAWQLLYGGRTRSSMAFLAELSAYGDRVVVVPQDEAGMLDLDSALGTVRDDTVVYSCGPSPMLNAVARASSAWPAHRIRVERFTPKELGAPVLPGSFEVSLARSGKTVQVGPGVSILAAVRGVGVPVLTSCEQGTCGTCETTVLEGVPDHRDSIYDEAGRRAADRMFICVSRSCTTRLALDL
jgi:ferredoxin-NADP reductase